MHRLWKFWAPRWRAQDIDVAFNPHFLSTGSARSAPTARLAMTTSTKPAVMTGKPANEEDPPDYRYLIMPIRLSS